MLYYVQCMIWPNSLKPAWHMLQPLWHVDLCFAGTLCLGTNRTCSLSLPAGFVRTSRILSSISRRPTSASLKVKATRVLFQTAKLIRESCHLCLKLKEGQNISTSTIFKPGNYILHLLQYYLSATVCPAYLSLQMHALLS